MTKVRKAFLLAPLAAPLISIPIAVIVAIAECVQWSKCFTTGNLIDGALVVAGFFLIASLISYFGSFILGIPAYRLCKRYNWLSIRHLCLAALILTIIIFLPIFLINTRLFIHELTKPDMGIYSLCLPYMPVS